LNSVRLEKYSLGVGDRFGQQAEAQLRACVLAAKQGVVVAPVWNKSHREHMIVGSDPWSTRQAADAAVNVLGWHHSHHVDADHIRLATVDRFLPHSDFFTLDVGDAIGQPVPADAGTDFAARHPELLGQISVTGIDGLPGWSRQDLLSTAQQYLSAVHEAGKIYRRIVNAKGEDAFLTEVSMDETGVPQSPRELLFILAALADEGVKLQTIAPKFCGRFNKGIDYQGNVAEFAKQFAGHLAVISFAVSRYDLPSTLKLSVHSGSDKFSLYKSMHDALVGFGAGLHLKTAGTTWLQELTGLAETGSAGLELVREIYSGALQRIDELCEPYASVIDINRKELPNVEVVMNWGSEQWVSAIVHDCRNHAYNPHLRQLLHVGYRIAAELGEQYLYALRQNKTLIAERVTKNLYERHLRPLFLGSS
jgi:hypothetical protein